MMQWLLSCVEVMVMLMKVGFGGLQTFFLVARWAYSFSRTLHRLFVDDSALELSRASIGKRRSSSLWLGSPTLNGFKAALLSATLFIFTVHDSCLPSDHHHVPVNFLTESRQAPCYIWQSSSRGTEPVVARSRFTEELSTFSVFFIYFASV